MTNAVILRLENITRQFPDTVLPAVANATLTLSQGDILALLGPSGCGKTTLLRLIAGFERPQTGTITLIDQPVAGQGHWVPPERRDVGMVFQDYALFPHLTVAANVGFGLEQSGKGRSKVVKEAIEEAIALVGLQGMENRYPHELSGGQQQRVALARALAPRPALVLLDEPLSNLDVQVRLYLRREVRDILKATDTSAIFVTHDQEEALAIADQVAVMRQGSIEQWGTPETLYREPRSRFVAEFVTQANFLPAQRHGGVWKTDIGEFKLDQVDLCSSEGVEISNEILGDEIQVGELMLRQEELIPMPDPTGTVVVRDRQFLGRDYCYRLQTASGQEIQVRTSALMKLSVGERVQVTAAHYPLRFFTLS